MRAQLLQTQQPARALRAGHGRHVGLRLHPKRQCAGGLRTEGGNQPEDVVL